jgi:nicotinamidase-related amidase
MEIYTGDLVDVAIEYAIKISKEIGYNGYIIEDECCNLQRDIRKKLYERLSKAFEQLIQEETVADIEHAYQYFLLKGKLFKIINEL